MGVVPHLTVRQKDTCFNGSQLYNAAAIVVIGSFTINNYMYGKLLYISRLAAGLLHQQPF